MVVHRLDYQFRVPGLIPSIICLLDETLNKILSQYDLSVGGTLNLSSLGKAFYRDKKMILEFSSMQLHI